MRSTALNLRYRSKFNLLAFLRGIGLGQMQFQQLLENGFDSLDRLEPLTAEMAASIGTVSCGSSGRNQEREGGGHAGGVEGRAAEVPC